MSLESSMAYLSWHNLAGCVLDVFEENLVKENTNTPLEFKANADVWAINDELRQYIWNRALWFWCKRTGLDSTFFPLSVDAVSRFYFRFRKRNADELKKFKEEIIAAETKKPCQFSFA